ncbi:NADH-quinone oxidoreductase subunit N [Swaminathania salitolerans]|uniref:NADH-quinone oxidoreductase subunit N n=1 Tax=Swaminathania salitolerans TaxID=182838 RepID=A0A511BKW3_9PROT|nr:NADH-quinone oxidoreductase subunit N [Swaminathania salitolerans]GBQ09397.1 NADH-quinone oxidoreductase subunit N [Swaminathania salitolerans LMG 21291]GEL00989.1 NADH-quinone oxidoreductase subunit N [Swaminathania salitolerans]
MSFSFLPNAVLVLCLGSLVQLAAISWRRHVARDAVLCVIVLLASLASIMLPTFLIMTGSLPLFSSDSWGSYAGALIILSVIAIVLMSRHGAISADPSVNSEYFILLTLATLGGVAMTCAVNVISFFLGLETLSLSLLGLIAFRNERLDAGEAAMKYLLLSGVASATLIFGFALIFAETGSLRFAMPDLSHLPEPMIGTMGVILVLTGMFFKLSAVPFHLWLADVLEGTTIPVASLVAVTSKIALFAAMLRYFSSVNLGVPSAQVNEILIVAVLSMLGGNLMAVVQTDLRRLLAGSSIAHVGYLLVAFLSPQPFGVASAAFYLAAYAISTLGVFAIMNGVLPQGRDIREWHGLFRRKPAAALAMSIMLISLAGIPPAVGFFAKFYIVAAGVSAHQILLLFVLILSSTIGLFYYLRLILIMLTPAPEGYVSRAELSMPTPANATLIAVLACATLVLGIVPGALVDRSQGIVVTPVPIPVHSTIP